GGVWPAPPRPLRPFPPGYCGIAEDAPGRVVALANHKVAYVQTPDRTYRLRPLDDARSVALSPDGRWLATGSFGHNGADIWRVHDGGRGASLAVERKGEYLFCADWRATM